MAQTIAHKAVRNTFFNGLSMAGPLLAGILKSAIIARHLGPSRMGVYSYAVWMAGMLSLVASLGLPYSLTKYVAEYIGRGDRAQAARLSWRLGSLQLKVILVVVLMLDLAALWFGGRSERLVFLLTASMSVPIVVAKVLRSILAGCQRYDRLALITLKSSAADVGFVVVAAMQHSGVAGFLSAVMAGTVVVVWLSYRDLRTLFAEGRKKEDGLTDTAISRRVRGFVLTESFAMMLDAIIWEKFEVVFLEAFSSFKQVAFYGISFGLATRLSDIPGSLTRTLMPLSSESFGRSGLANLGNIYKNAIKYVQLAVAPMCLLLIFTSGPLIGLIYGAGYLPLVPVLRALLASCAVTTLANIPASILYATEEQGFIARSEIPIALLNIVLDLLLIRVYGAMGAAVASASAQILETIALLAYAGRIVGVRFPWRTTSKVYGAAVLACLPLGIAVLSGAGRWVIVGLTPVGMATYIAIMVAWGELGWNELKIVAEAIGGPARPGLAGSAKAEVE